MTAPETPTSGPPKPDAWSRLIRFYKEHHIAIEALDEGNDLFVMVEGSDTFNNRSPIYRPVQLKTGDQIRIAVKHLIYYAWHFGEYIKHLAIEKVGMTPEQAKSLIHNHVKRHRSIQICAYLANEHKHSVLTQKQWADDLQPRYGELLVLFPDGQGTYCGFTGDEMPLEVSGTFKGPAIQSVKVYDKWGRMLGHARYLADQTAEAWVNLLERLGHRL